MFVGIFLLVIFGSVSILHSLKKWKTLEKQRLKNGIEKSIYHSPPKKIGRRKVKRFKHFRVPIPVIDGLYSLYLLGKYGLAVVHDWTSKMDPEHVYELPVGPYIVHLSKDASLTHKLLSSSDPGHLSRPRYVYHRIFVDMLIGGLFGTPVNEWSNQRKIISRAFTFKTYKCYIESMNKHSKNLARELVQLVKENDGELSGKKLTDCIHSNTIMITMEFIMGSKMSDTEDAIQYTKDFWEYKEIVMYRFLNPECYIPLVWWLHPKRRRMDQLSIDVNVFTKKIIDHYTQKVQPGSTTEENGNELQGNGKSCLIEEMLKYNASPEEIYNEIGTFLVAGHETIAVALNILLHHLACQPEYQARCRDEVDSIMGPYTSKSIFEDGDLTIDDLSNLEFLERFILESLRITPTVPFTFRELQSPLKVDENCKIGDDKIFLVSPWIIQRDPRYFPEPERFDPDRFLPEEVAKREPGTFFPFSGGMRNCIGKKFAMLALKTILAGILRNFELYTEDGLHDVKLLLEATVKPEREYRTTFKRRKITN